MTTQTDFLSKYVQRMEALRDHLAAVHGITRAQTEEQDPFESTERRI